MGVGTGNDGESQEEEEDYDEQVDFKSRVSLNSSTQETERLEPWKIWCGENDKQRHKHIRPAKRLCEYDKFGNPNWGEYKHRARQRIGRSRGG